MRVVEDDTKTEDAVPYWKIDDFLGFPGFSWVWVVLRAARAKKVETKRFYLLAKIGADTAENERNFAEIGATFPPGAAFPPGARFPPGAVAPPRAGNFRRKTIHSGSRKKDNILQ